MRARLLVVGPVLALAGCGDAITLEIAGDRPVPTAVDAICVGVADREPGGGQFGQAYRLEGALAALPQTLRVEAGDAERAWAWVRADRGGVPTAGAASLVDFDRDVTLALDRCVTGPARIPAAVGAPAGPANARLAVSQGPGGTLVVAVGATAQLLDVIAGALVATDAPAPRGTVTSVIAADLDGDCDDDLVVATDAGAPALWRRDGATFVEAGALGGGAVAAVGAADVDRDGDLDLVTAGGSTLSLWRNDGGGSLARDAAALSSAGLVTDARALALGDLDGDGNPDLVVGQGGGPLAAWVGEPGGTGSFIVASAAVPPVPLDVARLVLADLDGDFDPDLAVAVRNAPARLYIDRDGRLEDQSFIRLPQPAPVAHAFAVGGWDDGCEPDAVIASDAGGPMLAGVPGGALAVEATAPAGGDVVMADLDDDGDLDALVAGAQGVTWLAR